MKKLYFTTLLGALTLGATAQQIQLKLAECQPAAINWNNTLAAKPAATQTLTPPTFTTGACGTNTANIVFYSLQSSGSYTASGFAYGTNIIYYPQGPTTFTLTESRAAQKYNVAGTATITSVFVISAKHSSTAGTSMITAKIYSENTTSKAPASQVGVSATKALNSFTGNDQFTFSTPIVVPAGNFFASIESPTVGGATKDSLAITSTKQSCASADSLSWSYLQQVGGSGTWHSVMSGNAANNLDLLIFPVADIAPSTTGINSISKGDLTLLAAFPNPASSEVTINFGLNQDSKVEITLYDVAGKQVSTFKTDELSAGNHAQTINVSALNAGVYMYSVKSNNAQLFSKLTVVK